MSPHSLASLLLRALVLGLAVVHLGALLGNLAQTADRIDPSYLRHYARQHLLRPLAGLALAALLLVFESSLVAWLAAGT